MKIVLCTITPFGAILGFVKNILKSIKYCSFKIGLFYIINIFTPPSSGFGFSDEVDDKTIEDMVNYLKTNVTSTTKFLLLFKGVEKRFTKTTLDWLKVIKNVFGNNLWKHVLLGVS